MKLSEIKSILNAEVCTGQSESELEVIDIKLACGSDLMSDVLAYVKEKGLLLTGLMNTQVVRTAEMMDINAICFVRGKIPPEDVVELAKEMGVVLMATEYPLYVSCGKLYSNGLVC